MKYHRILKMLCYSLLGGFITAFTYMITDFNSHLKGTLFLDVTILPMAVMVTSLFAIIFGLLYSPLTYWSLKGKKLIIVLPFSYFFAVVVTAGTTLINPSFTLVVVMIYWTSVLLIMKYFCPEIVV